MVNSTVNASTSQPVKSLPLSAETTANSGYLPRSAKKGPDGLPNVDDFNSEWKSKGTPETAKFSYFQLFRYSTPCERFWVVFSILLAFLASLGVPYSVVMYAEYTALLIDREVGVGTSTPTLILQLFGGGQKLTNASREENIQAIRDDTWAYFIGSLAGAIVELIVLAMSLDIMNRVSLKQIGRIRKLFLEAILRQDMSWYDTNCTNNFASKLTEDLDKIKEGISEKLAIFTFLVMIAVTSVIVSFLYGWKLTLVVLICCPFIVLSTALVAKVQSSLAEKELKAYAGAGSVAEEVIAGIRTVLAFSGERKEVERYSNLLSPAEVTGRKKGLYAGLGGGFMWFIIYCCYALAIWYGVKLIIADQDKEVREYTTAVLVIVLFSIIMGAQNLGFASPHLEAFSTGTVAAQKVFAIIDRQPAIDSLDERGERPQEVIGNITFEDIKFHYPARPDVEILKGLNLEVKAGETVALVGASGCGKSTTLQLLQRIYDPLVGVVKLDGHDLRDLNVGWLRSQIGVVGQEPVLFATTIEENIRYGKPTATQKEIERAARMANCHEFIVKLPKGYATLVGARGAQLSGGQKQRIAIARALVRNPRVLLLDEATSALDPSSERRVQEALEVASKGRTTLVVSHRLSTVTNANKIVVVKNGVVAEQGTHDELMKKGGLYTELVNITKQKERTEEEVTVSELNIESTSGTNLSQGMRDRNIVENRGTEEDDSNEDEDEADYDEDAVKNGVAGSVNTSVKAGRQKGKPKRKLNKHRGEEKYKVTFWQLMKLNAPEWRLILCGCIASMIYGATYPVWAILFGDFFGVMSSNDNDYIQSQANLFAYLFLVIGVVAGVGTLVQTYMFNAAGIKMTTRLRKTTFKTILTQNVTFFDDEKNTVGTLCARLAGDCSNVQGATGARVGVIVQAVSTVVIGTIAALFFSWTLTLITLCTVPFVCASIFLEARFMEASTYIEKAALEKASDVAVEAISNIQTVWFLGQEQHVMERYSAQLDRVSEACRRKNLFRGSVFGFGQTAPFMAYSISLYYGGMMVADGNVAYEDIIKVAEALIFGSWMLGQALAYAPNVSAAIISAGRLIKFFEQSPTVYDPQDKPYNDGSKLSGDVTYEHVDFHYPSRKEVPILKNLNLLIKSGTTVALVGPSGSGKSTCVQLLLRYYDPIIGSVNLSGVPSTEFALDTLRSQLGLVSQEPILFDRTIAQNIAYGDNFRNDIPMTEIIEAAKMANIHNFIASLPHGYDTPLGNQGAQLSGGQKQRIAIARALVRNPKILILDEATSALDMESEKVVQEALDVASHGRTCITIAHRLTTVRDADLICVLKKGEVVEKGTHDELIAANGLYAQLYLMQQVI